MNVLVNALEKVNINLFTLPTLLQLRILGAEVNTGERRMNGAAGPGSVMSLTLDNFMNTN